MVIVRVKSINGVEYANGKAKRIYQKTSFKIVIHSMFYIIYILIRNQTIVQCK